MEKNQWLEQRINNGIITYFILYRDESTLRKLELHRCSWFNETVSGLIPKSAGNGSNISDFIMSWNGFLRGEFGNNACVLHKIGGDAKREEYHWNVHCFEKQIVKALKRFQDEFKLHTDRRLALVRPVFALDNAACHAARPENATNAYKMNVNPGTLPF